jgi:hypothetical protein
MNDRRPAWVDRAREVLDASAAHLDAPTLSRLNRARQAALASRRRTPRWLPWSGGLVAAAALALALVFVLPHRQLPAPAPVPAQALETDGDADLLGGDEAPELVQDLDFYAWLDAQERQDG